MGLLLSRNALNYQATFSNFIRIYFFSCQLTLILSLICSILRKYTIKVTLYICNEKRYVYQQISFQRLSINNNKNVEFYHLFLYIIISFFPFSVLFSCTAILLYPYVFGTDRTKAVCPNATSYHMGPQCQLGWSYMLAISGCAIATFCPYLARHIDVFLEECDPPEIFWERDPSETGLSRERTISSFKSTSTHSSFVT